MKNTLAWLVGVILATSFCYFFYILVSYDYQWARVAPYAGNLFSGWGVTVLISVIALVCSTLIAVGLTAAELSSVAPAKWRHGLTSSWCVALRSWCRY